MTLRGRVRCFVSVDIEEGGVVEKIIRIQNDLQNVGARFKLVEPNNLHLTLAFIGEIPPSLVDAVKKALNEIKYNSFEVTFKGLGAFPGLSRPRVIWVGVSKGADKLVELANTVRASLKRGRIPFDKKEFIPHLTIARVKSGSSKLCAFLKKNADIDVGSITVAHVRLKKSTLTSRGPIYEALYEIQLE